MNKVIEALCKTKAVGETLGSEDLTRMATNALAQARLDDAFIDEMDKLGFSKIRRKDDTGNSPLIAYNRIIQADYGQWRKAILAWQAREQG
jgi:hypothetical protein